MSQKIKVEVKANSAYKLLHPMHTVLVTSVGETGKPNIITLAWAMPASISPTTRRHKRLAAKTLARAHRGNERVCG